MKIVMPTFVSIVREASNREGAIATGVGSVVLRVAGLVSTFALGVLLARLLGPEDYGLYGLIIALSALTMTVAHMGTYQLAVRELSVRSSRGDWAGARRIVVECLIVATSASVILSAAAMLAAALIFETGSDEIFLIGLGCLLTVLLTVSTLMAAELRGLGALIKGQFFEFLGRPALALCGAVLLIVFIGQIGPAWALWLQVAAALIALIVSAVWLRGALPPTVELEDAPRNYSWLKAALPLGMVELLRQIDGTYGLILVAAFASSTDVGVFRVAIACLPLLAMPGAIFHMVLAPRIARLHATGQTDELQGLLRAISLLLVALLLPATILVGAFGRGVIAFVFGPAYADAAEPLFLFACAQTIFAFFGMGPVLLAMAGRERHLTKIYLGAVATAIVAAFPLVANFGASGAAMAQVISLSAIGILSWRHARHSLKLELTFVALRKSSESTGAKSVEEIGTSGAD